MNTAGVGIYIEIVAEARTQKFLNGEKKKKNFFTLAA